jgi:hypothetical protein
MALTLQAAVRPLLGNQRLLVAIDDTPTACYGPCVEGCGAHHNPTPGPAGQKHVYGHVWVVRGPHLVEADQGNPDAPGVPNRASPHRARRGSR